MKIIAKIFRFFRNLRSASSNKAPVNITGKGNRISNNGHFFNVRIDISGNENEIVIGKNTSIHNALIYIKGNNHRIIFRDNCFLGKGELWLEDNNCELYVDEFTTIEGAHLAVTEPFSKLIINKDCMLANNVEIRTGDSHSIIDLNTGERINKASNVVLGEHVWVGAHAKILKGVTIGSHAIIGTASVVNKDVPEKCIVAGIPAKEVRSNVSWRRERI